MNKTSSSRSDRWPRCWTPVLLACILVLSISCAFPPVVKPTLTPAANSTNTPPPETSPTTTPPGATSTAAPAPATPEAATATPENTLPSPTAAAQATQTPAAEKISQQGPWLLIYTSNGLWATNSDGSAITQITKTPSNGAGYLQSAPSPDGKSIAFISSDDFYHNLKLNLMSMPDGQVKTVTALTNPSTEPGPDTGTLDAKIEAVRAITGVDSLEWSPDGKTLAFIGVQAGTSADLYTYSLGTGKIAHLSDGPAQAYGPHWSPDGQYIVNFGVTTFGTGAGYSMAGGWATKGDGSAIITLFQPGGSTQDFDGWVTAHSFLINSWTPACGPQDLRVYDLATQKETSLLNGCFSEAAVSSVNGMILAAGGGGSAGLNGLTSFAPGTFTRKDLSKDPATSVRFLKQDGTFLVKFNTSQAIYNSTGDLVVQAPQILCESLPNLAAFGALYAWTCPKGEVGAWVNGPGVPAARVFSQDGADFPAWSGKNTLFFISGQTLYRALFPDFKPEPAGQLTGNLLGIAWAGQP